MFFFYLTLSFCVCSICMQRVTCTRSLLNCFSSRRNQFPTDYISKRMITTNSSIFARRFSFSFFLWLFSIPVPLILCLTEHSLLNQLRAGRFFSCVKLYTRLWLKSFLSCTCVCCVCVCVTYVCISVCLTVMVNLHKFIYNILIVYFLMGLIIFDGPWNLIVQTFIH